MAEKDLFVQANTQLIDGRYKDAIKMYDSFDVLYPLSRNLESSMINHMYALYMNTDYELAIALSERIIMLYPRSKRIIYIYYLRGMCYMKTDVNITDSIFSVHWPSRDVNRFKMAFPEFKLVAKKAAPDSRYALSAIKYMRFIRNILAQSDLEIAQYYFDNNMYVAASNIALSVIINYIQSPQVPEALLILRYSNAKLGLNNAVADIDNLIKLNYPKLLKKTY